jgi:hypothetical protein
MNRSFVLFQVFRGLNSHLISDLSTAAAGWLLDFVNLDVLRVNLTSHRKFRFLLLLLSFVVSAWPVGHAPKFSLSQSQKHSAGTACAAILPSSLLPCPRARRGGRGGDRGTCTSRTKPLALMPACARTYGCICWRLSHSGPLPEIPAMAIIATPP